ncbi:sugar phosphate isomerase/epimerase [Parafrankia sp. BMG5.11]|uniref:sugar phosphate isomerase/epimerase family protein n=1 Tax=Parafrankia sp. BMG5.11 TaxID=222540 RepID=UPI00103FC1F9|nr:TIM barrel protein [Parafrankia sp. BMG5.11]TCJ37027.1 sugar phosphate isomerase/epimerase [Parafrankia sp. BMG5.11]
MRRLALDHLTVVDADPFELAVVASGTGCEGICLFMQPMEVLPSMPAFDLYGDRTQRRRLGTVLADLGVALDLAYPFTLSGRTTVSDFAPAMECAAELGTGALNALIYDREPSRRAENFGSFCDLASRFSLKVAVEFYPVSQVRTISDALTLVQGIGRPETVGINVDLLHLMRSGGSVADLASIPPEYIRYAQVCDGPALRATEDFDFEASSDRLLPGEGSFDVEGFVTTLPTECPISIEVPRNADVGRLPSADRALAAVDATRAVLNWV